MNRRPRMRHHQRGFTLLEVLVSLVILVFGLLGLIGMQAYTQVATFESYQRGQALILVQDMADRIATNRAAAGCYAITTSTTTYVGASGTVTPSCTAGVGTTATRAIATADLVAWDGALKGASEQAGGASVGGMIGARGCVTYDAATNSYRVSISWQGMAPTIAPTVGDANATCAQGASYGSENQRREVSVIVRIAVLT